MSKTLANTPATKIDLNSLTTPELNNLLISSSIALTSVEALRVQNEVLNRPVTISELILWGIQGSEHCSYRSSRQFLRQFPTKADNVMVGVGQDAGIVRVAVDNTGKKYGIAISHESHNSPSQVVPFEGAATGIGGNVRDVNCMGARVIGVSDSLRFGQISNQYDSNNTNDELIHKAKWINKGVVEGVAGYGNPIGVANVGGDLYYDNRYNGACLVNVVTLGTVAEDEIISSHALPGSVRFKLILIGKPTDRSGFGGASFSSKVVDEGDNETNKGAVQEPNAFLKRHILKANYALFDKLKNHSTGNMLQVVSFKDLGAGGVACASVEIADGGGYGANIYVEKIHTSIENLDPAIILCSETQERFLWCVPDELVDLVLDHYNVEFDFPNVSSGAKASVVGEITDDGMYTVFYNNAKIIEAKASLVTEGLSFDREFIDPKVVHSEPEVVREFGEVGGFEATEGFDLENGDLGSETVEVDSEQQGILRYAQNDSDKDDDESIFEIQSEQQEIFRDAQDDGVNNNNLTITINGITKTLTDISKEILAHPNVACRYLIYEKYDKNCGGFMVVEAGEGDSCVMQPFKFSHFPSEIHDVGVVFKADNNPNYGKINPYWGAVQAVVECARNIACSGGFPEAMTDCLNFGNPEKPEQFWDFTESVRGLSEACNNFSLVSNPFDSTLILSENIGSDVLPVISGNVSLYKESTFNNLSQAIPPTPMVSMVGVMPIATKAVNFSLRSTESTLLLIGDIKNECGGSTYYSLFNALGANSPRPDVSVVRDECYIVSRLIQNDLVQSCHDISDGGLMACLAEMSFRNSIGFELGLTTDSIMDVELDQYLFSESGGFVLEVLYTDLHTVQEVLDNNEITYSVIGSTNSSKVLDYGVFALELVEAKELWTEGLKKLL